MKARVAEGLNRKRFWKRHRRAAFDPKGIFVFLRPTRVSAKDVYRRGNLVPSGLPEEALRRWWGSERIALANFDTNHERLQEKKVSVKKVAGIIERIVDEIGKLDPNNPEHWTGAGLPQVMVLKNRMDEDITAKQRTEAWGLYQEQEGAQ